MSGYEPLRAPDGRHATSARPLHRRHCPALSGHLLCPFPPPSSLRKPPRRTAWGGRCVICLVDAQAPWSCPDRRDRDKSPSFFPGCGQTDPLTVVPFSFSSFLHGLCPRPSGLGPSGCLTPTTLPSWCPGPFDRETPPPHAYAPSPWPHIPSVCVSPSASILPSLLFLQTTKCKRGSLLAWLFIAPVTPLVIHPTAHVKGGDPLAGVQSDRRTLFSSLLRQPNHPTSLLSAIVIQP